MVRTVNSSVKFVVFLKWIGFEDAWVEWEYYCAKINYDLFCLGPHVPY